MTRWVPHSGIGSLIQQHWAGISADQEHSTGTEADAAKEFMVSTRANRGGDWYVTEYGQNLKVVTINHYGG